MTKKLEDTIKVLGFMKRVVGQRTRVSMKELRKKAGGQTYGIEVAAPHVNRAEQLVDKYSVSFRDDISSGKLFWFGNFDDAKQMLLIFKKNNITVYNVIGNRWSEVKL